MRRLLEDEPYQRYVKLRLFLGDDSRKTPEFEFSRPVQFVIEITGDYDFVPVITVQPLMLQLMLDGKETLEADDPLARAEELAPTLVMRTAARLDNVVPRG